MHYYNAGIGFCYAFLTVLTDLEITVVASMGNSLGGLQSFMLRSHI